MDNGWDKLRRCSSILQASPGAELQRVREVVRDYSPLWILNFISKKTSWCNHPFSTPCIAEGSLQCLAGVVKGSVLHMSFKRHPTCRGQLSRRGETSNMFPCTTSLTVGSPLERTERGKLWPSKRGAVSASTAERPGPVQKRTQDLWSKNPPHVCRQKRSPMAAPWGLSPSGGIHGRFGSQHWHWPCSLPAASSHLLSPSCCMTSGSPTLPPPICYGLCWMVSTQHEGFGAISAPVGLREREMCLPRLSFPYHPDSTCEGENKRKKETKTPTPLGKNV